jgi:hypothetical protein
MSTDLTRDARLALGSRWTMAIALGVTAVFSGGQSSAKMPPRTDSTEKVEGPTKIDLAASTTTVGDDTVVDFELTLKDAGSRPSPALGDTPITIEVARAKSPEQTLERLETVAKSGSTTAHISWKATVFGVLQAKAGSKDKDLLWGVAAFLVRPKAVDKVEKAKQDAPTEERAPEPRKKPRKSGTPHPTTGWGRWHAAGACQQAASKPAESRPSPPPRLPQLIMTVSGRGPEGVAADGKDAAKVDVFYDADDGAAAPRDIRVWFHWEGGTIEPQPLVIKAGTFQAQAQWTSPSPVVGTVNIEDFPEAIVTSDRKPVQVKFVRPILGLKMRGPERLSFIEVGEFSVEFMAADGTAIVNPNDRTLAFTSGDTQGRLNPKEVRMSAGALQATTSFTPTSFGGIASILASTDGYRPYEHRVIITYWSCVLLALVGGALGGLMRFFRSQGTWYLRLLNGVVLGSFAVLVFVVGVVQGDLSFFPTVIKNNLLSVPVAAFIAGWAGLELLDSIAPFARGFTGAK